MRAPSRGHDSQEQGFVPIQPNPYIVGPPVRDRSMFFGREAEFQLVKKRFGDSQHGGIIVFCGERRSGKTSILYQILEGRLGPDFLPVLVDMQSMVVDNEAEFFARIAAEIARTLRTERFGLAVPDFAAGSNASQEFLRFIDELMERFPEKRPILLIDEYELLETKIQAGTISENVLYALAALLQKHPFFYVFTGSRNFEERTEAYWRILGQSIAQRISFLQKSDAIDLITKPVAGRVEYAEGTLDRLVRLGAGQPFYTQALCLSIVDLLNEQRSNVATIEAIDTVVSGIVSNPFPQMVFLWESLTGHEKLALALLAEALPSDSDHASVEDLYRLMCAKRYPVSLTRENIEGALEELCTKELLERDTKNRRGYAYKIDLWRLWILREHTVWQVVREEGLEKQPRRVRRLPVVTIAGTSAVVLSAALAWMFQDRLRELPGGDARRPSGLPETVASLSIKPYPETAAIFMDGDSIVVGRFAGHVSPNHKHVFRITAAGYEDTTFVETLGEGKVIGKEVYLRPLTAALAVSSIPPGASVTVDDVPRGRTPMVVRDLAVNRAHHVEVVEAGYVPCTFEPLLAARDTATHVCRLVPVTFPVAFTTSPPRAEIWLDGVLKGRTPLPLHDLSSRSYSISAKLPGYTSTDTILVLSPATPAVHLVLEPEPPGILVLLGDAIARSIFIDDRLIVANVQNSGPCTLSTGVHHVEIELQHRRIEKRIEVPPGGTVVYDYVHDAFGGSRP